MPSITLSSQSVFPRRRAPHFSSPSCPKPLSSCAKPSNLFAPCSSRLCFRYSRQYWVKICDPGLREFSCSDTGNADANEFRVLNCNSCNATNLVRTMDDCSTSADATSENKSRRESCMLADVPALDASFHRYLKFALLCGAFTLQGTREAVAAADFANGLESLSFLGDLGDISTGFASAFLLIFFSELGDKTFFIAALLAARNSAGVVFLGTFGALSVMTVISVVLGRTFHYVDDILPFRLGDTDLPVDDIAAVLLLVYFGVSTLLDASSDGSSKAEEEQKECATLHYEQAELAVSELSGTGAGILAAANTVLSTFLLVFVAEWGDKSFFSTIALAAASSPLGVIGGALAGHGFATLVTSELTEEFRPAFTVTNYELVTGKLAVLGGSLLGTFLSEKVIAYIGGALFLVFAAVTLVEIVN
ncbi:hypothetical protein RJ639_021856 [Escallonia herrerae]|uniref:GDT1 family protein n=1 Tax=Escallonia herrerae TaxID=1293975 RepID=A0AA89AFM9_9ASTE|nr:hypothetical protein RJ639_021856 [Escallonia herrerae]